MASARILIVEDDPLVADDIERTVKKLGYKIAGKAVSGKEAIAITEREQPDAVLMDIRIKGDMDGIETGGTIKNRFGTALIYLTAHSDTATFERAKITEPYGYVVKPFQEADLRIALGLALYKRSQELIHSSELPIFASTASTEGSTETRAGREPRTIPPHTRSAINGEAMAFLRGLDLFAHLPEAELQSLAVLCTFENHSHGDLIVCEGEEEPTCFVVVEGRVSLVKSSENGNQLIVEMLFPGDLFSIIAAFEEDVASLTARTQRSARVLRIPKKALFGLLGRHPDFYKIFVRESTRRLRTAHNMMRALAHDKVESRIASVLAELALRPLACPVPDEGVRITRQEIADITGTSVESAIRITRDFEEQGILGLSKRGSIKILKPAELRQLAAN